MILNWMVIMIFVEFIIIALKVVLQSMYTIVWQPSFVVSPLTKRPFDVHVERDSRA